jgi:hypothetical protein
MIAVPAEQSRRFRTGLLQGELWYPAFHRGLVAAFDPGPAVLSRNRQPAGDCLVESEVRKRPACQ